MFVITVVRAPNVEPVRLVVGCAGPALDAQRRAHSLGWIATVIETDNVPARPDAERKMAAQLMAQLSAQ